MRSWTERGLKAIQRGRTTIPFSASVLAIVLAFNSAGPALRTPEPPENPPVESSEQRRAAQAKAEVTRRSVGHKACVRVKLRGKHELKGHITQIDEDSFQMLVDQGGLDAQSAQDRLITIRYSEVEKIRGPRSRAVSVAADVGLTVVALAVLPVILVVEVYKHGHHY
jgi:hypothetical protein